LKGWHKCLKTALKLGKNQRSSWSLLGVVQHFEDCAQEYDSRYQSAINSYYSRDLALCYTLPWLKEFPLPAQVILADSYRLAENRQFNEYSQEIHPLDDNGKCNCKHFRKWNLPCEHMLETFIFQGSTLEPDWSQYAAMFQGTERYDVYEGHKLQINLIEAGEDSQGDHQLNRVLARKLMLYKLCQN